PDRSRVNARIVVGPQRGDPTPRYGEILSSPAQITCRRERGIIDVVRTDDPVVVGVDPVQPPGLGDELHRSHRAFRPGLPIRAVRFGRSGIHDAQGAAGAVETNTPDRRSHIPVGRYRRAPVGAVMALHLPDTGP